MSRTASLRPAVPPADLPRSALLPPIAEERRPACARPQRRPQSNDGAGRSPGPPPAPASALERADLLEAAPGAHGNAHQRIGGGLHRQVGVLLDPLAETTQEAAAAGQDD